MATRAQHKSKTKLLNAALNVIRAKGYAATTVDDICHAAGVTKGSFFHHFESKDDLALSAAGLLGRNDRRILHRRVLSQVEKIRWNGSQATSIFAVRYCKANCPDYTCLLGTLVQETYATHPDIRAACDKGLVNAYRHYHPRCRRRQEALCAGRALERRKASASSFNRFCKALHLRQGEARPRGRARKSRAFAALSRHSVYSVRPQPPAGGTIMTADAVGQRS